MPPTASESLSAWRGKRYVDACEAELEHFGACLIMVWISKRRVVIRDSLNAQWYQDTALAHVVRPFMRATFHPNA